MFINYQNNQVYSGDKSDYRDIECTSDRPSQYHDPVITEGVHAGWTLRRLEAEEALYKKYTDTQDQSIKALTESEYAEQVTKTFDKQDREAREYLLNQSADTPLIDSICSARNIAKADLVTKIIAKSDAYTNAIGYLIGHYDALKENIPGMTDEELIDYLLAE